MCSQGEGGSHGWLSLRNQGPRCLHRGTHHSEGHHLSSQAEETQIGQDHQQQGRCGVCRAHEGDSEAAGLKGGHADPLPGDGQKPR